MSRGREGRGKKLLPLLKRGKWEIVTVRKVIHWGLP